MPVQGKPKLRNDGNAIVGGRNDLMPPWPVGLSVAYKVRQGIYPFRIVMIKIFKRINLRMKTLTRPTIIKVHSRFHSDAKCSRACEKDTDRCITGRYRCVCAKEIYGVEHWILRDRGKILGTLSHHDHSFTTQLIQLLNVPAHVERLLGHTSGCLPKISTRRRIVSQFRY